MKLHFFKMFICGTLLVLDQGAKLFFQQRDAVIINRGGIFGLLPSSWWTMLIIIIWLLILFKQYRLDKIGWGITLILTGGLSNLVDRLLFNGVRDYIYYPWFNIYGNLADIILGLGIISTIVKYPYEFKSQHSL